MLTNPPNNNMIIIRGLKLPLLPLDGVAETGVSKSTESSIPSLSSVAPSKAVNTSGYGMAACVMTGENKIAVKKQSERKVLERVMGKSFSENSVII